MTENNTQGSKTGVKSHEISSSEVVAMKKGVFIFSNGDTYEGDFWINEDGHVERHGTGTFFRVDGLQYRGEWFKDKMNGQGKLTHPSGAVYEGQFISNKYFGEGKYNFPDGSYYEGRFVDNKVQGYSTFTDPYGQVWKGTFHQSGANALKFKLEM
uniref:MORN repeat-containing protein 5 n=1 Tax=Strigamia maritima TaxID=126957 RepID=T1J7C4_STRMM